MAYQKKESQPKKDYYQEITNEIIAAMENGELPWQKGWDSKVGSMICPQPISGVSKHGYTKENAVRLSVVMGRKDSSDPRFFTFNQAKKQGWLIRKGAKGTWVKCGFLATKDAEGNELPQEDWHWTKNYITVFHATDCCKSMEYVKDENGKTVYERAKNPDGSPMTQPVIDKQTGEPVMIPKVDDEGKELVDENGNQVMVPKEKPVMVPMIKYEPIPEYIPPKVERYTHEEKIELAELALERSKAVILHDQADSAFYRLNTDEIHLPPKEAFPDLADYYATALHELGHWTGHEDRLDRKFGKFGDPTYAKEELRAELASVYLSMDLGIPLNTMNHAAYVQSWVKNLKDDKMEIFKAANDAAKIAEYVKDFVRDKLKERNTGKNQSAEPVKEAKEVLLKDDEGEEKAKSGAVKDDKAIVKVYKPLDESLLGKDWSEVAQKPLDLNKYEVVLNKPLSFYPYRNNGEPFNDDEIFSRALDKTPIGSIVQVDEELFYVNPTNDRNHYLELRTTRVKDRLILSAVESAEVQRTIEEQKAQVGEKTFEDYRQKFREVFREGAALSEEKIDFNDPKNLEKGYKAFIYTNAVRYGLSSIRPCADKAWLEADNVFMKMTAEMYPGDRTKLTQAAQVVSTQSPYAIVNKDFGYAMKLFQNASKNMRETPKEERIAAKSVGR